MLTATKVRFWWNNGTGSGGSFCRGTECMSTRLRSCELFTSYPVCKWKITIVTVHDFRFRRAPHHFADKVWPYDYVWSVHQLILLAFLTSVRMIPLLVCVVFSVSTRLAWYRILSYRIVSYRTSVASLAVCMLDSKFAACSTLKHAQIFCLSDSYMT